MYVQFFFLVVVVNVNRGRSSHLQQIFMEESESLRFVINQLTNVKVLMSADRYQDPQRPNALQANSSWQISRNLLHFHTTITLSIKT